MKQIIKNETKCSIGCLIINLLLNFSRCFQCFRFIYQRNIKFQKDIYNDLPFDHVTSQIINFVKLEFLIRLKKSCRLFSHSSNQTIIPFTCLPIYNKSGNCLTAYLRVMLTHYLFITLDGAIIFLIIWKYSLDESNIECIV